jgi:hypothetical protein
MYWSRSHQSYDLKPTHFCSSEFSLDVKDLQHLFTQTAGYTRMSQHRRLPVGASLTWSYL